MKLINEGKSVREVSKIIGKAKSTVFNVIKKVKCDKTFENKPSSGHPKQLTEKEERIIVRKIKDNPKLSVPKLTCELQMETGKSVC